MTKSAKIEEKSKEFYGESDDSESPSPIYREDEIVKHAGYLKRQELVNELKKLTAKYPFVRITSPAASGRTTLLSIFGQSWKKTKVIRISCLSDKSCIQLLKEFASIDLAAEKCPEEYQRTIICFDDAQCKFEDRIFWTREGFTQFCSKQSELCHILDTSLDWRNRKPCGIFVHVWTWQDPVPVELSSISCDILGWDFWKLCNIPRLFNLSSVSVMD